MANDTNPGEPARWLESRLAAPPTDECVEWPYSRNTSGYGQLWDGDRQRPVTHVVLERTGSPRPPAPWDNALHSCHNPPCVNRRHLRWGTHAENMADKRRAGRQMSHEDHALAKLTQEQVDEMRERYEAGGILQRELADEYCVSEKTVSAIVRYERWKYVAW